MVTFVVQIGLHMPGIARGDLFIWWLHLGVVSVGISPGALSARIRRLRATLQPLG